MENLHIQRLSIYHKDYYLDWHIHLSSLPDLWFFYVFTTKPHLITQLISFYSSDISAYYIDIIQIYQYLTIFLMTYSREKLSTSEHKEYVGLGCVSHCIQWEN
jgi:hypothetical protein